MAVGVEPDKSTRISRLIESGCIDPHADFQLLHEAANLQISRYDRPDLQG